MRGYIIAYTHTPKHPNTQQKREKVCSGGRKVEAKGEKLVEEQRGRNMHSVITIEFKKAKKKKERGSVQSSFVRVDAVSNNTYPVILHPAFSSNK